MGYDGGSSEGPVHFTSATFGMGFDSRNGPGTKSFNNVGVSLVKEAAGCAGRELSYEGEDDVERKLGLHPWL